MDGQEETDINGGEVLSSDAVNEPIAETVQETPPPEAVAEPVAPAPEVISEPELPNDAQEPTPELKAEKPVTAETTVPEVVPVPVLPEPTPLAETADPQVKGAIQDSKAEPKKADASEHVEGAVLTVPAAQVAPIRPDPMEVAKALDHDVLEAAFKILSMERLGKMRDAKKANDARKIAETSERITDFVSRYKNGVRRTTIADKLNLSPSKVTDYLQRLTTSGRVRAEGKTNDRRFYIT